jgi:hypothetical protein
MIEETALMYQGVFIDAIHRCVAMLYWLYRKAERLTYLIMNTCSYNVM